MKKVITFGTFDLFHNGHLNILERAKTRGDYLIVGVSSDYLNVKKHKVSVMSEKQRAVFVDSLHCVDEVFIEESLELKQDYISTYGADLLVMGDDWRGKFDWVSCEVEYLPRTTNISTTLMKLALMEEFKQLRVFLVTGGSEKHRACAKPIVDYMNKIGFSVREQSGYNDYPDIKFDAIIDFNEPVRNLREIYPKTPIFIIDHGASNLKWFLKNQRRYNSVDYFLTAGTDHVDSMQAFFGNDNSIKATAFVKSDLLFSDAEQSRVSFCHQNNLDVCQPIILYAPTWLKEVTDDHIEILNQLSKISNHIICQHIDHGQFGPNPSLNIVKNNKYNIIEFMKHADIVITDTSSILQEAAALAKPTIQILMQKYMDNPSKNYQLPITAGTNKFFLAGLPTRPKNLVTAVNSLSKYEDSIKFLQSKALKGTTIKSNPCRDIIEGLINGVSSYSETVLKDKGNYENNRQKIQRHLNLMLTNKIAHAGGEIDGVKYTNSLEAIKNSSNKFKLIEVDICRAKDGLIVAHDGLEKKYGFDRTFDQITIELFKKSKYSGKYTSLSFLNLANYSVGKYVNFILDIKEIRAGYTQSLSEISNACRHLGVLDKFIPQVYCPQDLESAISSGFDRCIIALWKHYDTQIFSNKTFDFLDYCFGKQEITPIGISLRHEKGGVIRTEQTEVLKLQGYGARVYIHGQDKDKDTELLNNNFGIFCVDP